MAGVAPDEQSGGRSAAPATRAVMLAAILLGTTVACGQTPRRTLRVDQALGDPRPAERAAGIAAVGRGCDRSRIPDLIEMLDDPDPTVRLTSGATLRDLTGYDTGYRPWADVVERRAQVHAWRRWWVGETPRPIPPGSTTPDPRHSGAPDRGPPRSAPHVPTPVGGPVRLPDRRAPVPEVPEVPEGGLPPPVIRVVRGTS